ncbi:HAD family acid phosphatase [Moorella naiadis]|uniref:5' nucleotidase, NT5C type n=1 Tax=Moorella naiadis (nom. illeg.) TaxID=3093670 RepID=UPI003D9CA232
MVAKIGIDICNTIADVNECIRQALNPPDACFKEYGLSRYGIDEEWFTKHLELFAEAKPMPGAVEALDILASGGIEIYYLTARPEKARGITVEWLKRWGFPEVRLIMTREKDEAAKELGLGLVMEDAPPEIAKLEKVGIDVVIYRQPYNKGMFTWEK